MVHLAANSPCTVALSVGIWTLSNRAGHVMTNSLPRFQHSQWLLLELEDLKDIPGSAPEEIFSDNFHWQGSTCKNYYLQIKDVNSLS